MLVLKTGLRNEIGSIAFAPNGAALAVPSGIDCALVFPELNPSVRWKRVPVPITNFTRVAFHPGGEHLYCWSWELCAARLSDRTAEPVPLPKWSELWAGVSPDGAHLVVGEKVQPVVANAEPVARWTCFPALGPWKPLWQVAFEGSIYSAPMFLPGGARFTALERRPSDMSHRFVRSIETGAELDRSSWVSQYCDTYAQSSNGEMLVGVRGMRIDVAPTSVVPRWREIRNDNQKHFTAVAFHPSGKYLAATSNDTTAKLYDTATWEVARAFTWNIGKLRSVAFSPDGTLAAAGSDRGEIVVWDVDV